MHIIADLYECPFEAIDNAKKVESILTAAAEKANCNILNIFSYQFKPQGCTVILTIAESHIAFHSFPEESKAALDIYTCGQNHMPFVILQEAFINFLPGSCKTIFLERFN